MPPDQSRNRTGKSVILDEELFDLLDLNSKSMRILYRVLERKPRPRPTREVRAIITPTWVRSK